MRYLLALLFTFLIPQSPDAFPPLGIIDFYGLRTVPEAQLLQALPYHLDDSIPVDQFKSQKHAVEQKLASLPGIAGAYLTLVCCTRDRKAILYVGIEEPTHPANKQAIVPDLVAAMRDPDPDVRNNSTRALLVFAEFSPKAPAQKIKISPRPFIELLNSCIWSDRNKSSGAGAQLTEKVTRCSLLKSATRLSLRFWISLEAVA